MAKNKTLDKKTVPKPTPGKTAPKPRAKAKTEAGAALKVSRSRKGLQPAGALASAAADMLRAAQSAGAVAAEKPATPAAADSSEASQPGSAPYAELMAGIVTDFGLSEREARFVMEMSVDGNASAAYIRAGYSPKQANANAARLNAKDSIQAALARVRAKVAERAGFTAEEALQMAADILRADTRELVEYKVGCCRYCHGDGHRYQRTAGEMAVAREKHNAQVARRQERNRDYEDPGFDEQGGEGFDIRREPNAACPVCGGDGEGKVVIKDTRKVSKAAAALYAGVKEGKDGIEVKFHDKATMLEKMFRYHGLYEVDNKQKSAAAADPAALVALAEAMDRSREQRLAIMERRRQLGFTGD